MKQKFEHIGTVLGRELQKQIMGGDIEEIPNEEDDNGICPGYKCSCRKGGVLKAITCCFADCSSRGCDGGWACSV